MEKNKILVEPSDYDTAIANGYNEDLAPLPAEQRKWGFFNYFTLWMGSVHNVPNYLAVGGFLFLGMSPVNVMLALILSSFGVMGLLILNGLYGFDYGIPSTMALRSTYGSKGAKLPGVLRGLIAAIMWYGLQTYAGSKALLILIGKIYPAFLNIGGGFEFLGIGLPALICFIIFWTINLIIGIGGGDSISKFTAVLNPLIYIVFGGMVIWAVRVNGGLGPILNYSSGVTRTSSNIFIYLMIISSVLSVWAAPGVSSSDFGRNAKDFKSFSLGQGVGLFVSYLLFAFSSVFILIGATVYYQTPMWDVLEIVNKWDSLIAVAFSMVVLLMTTISTNATGNIIPAGYQLATLFPKKVDFRKGVILASIISFVICPWKLMENQNSIYLFLDIIGSLMGPIAGTMIAHYLFIVKRDIWLTRIYAKEVNLYKPDVNYAAYGSTIVGAVVPLTFKFIEPLAKYSQVSWIIAFIVAFLLYVWLGKTQLRNQTNRTADEMPIHLATKENCKVK
ncbi:MAG: cytosine permease [Bacillota bacterium]|nr:cytosine permease [Bacillota bacterium]